MLNYQINKLMIYGLNVWKQYIRIRIILILPMVIIIEHVNNIKLMILQIYQTMKSLLLDGLKLLVQNSI